jgi:1-deoxy-D-xylulose-5-phosphate reductoisomerase
MARLDLTRIRELTFAAPDLEAFPCLSYALEAARRGGTVPASLNAANEAAVEAFCARKIGFLDIARVVRCVLDSWEDTPADNLSAVLEADAVARERAWSCIKSLGNRNVC